MDFVKCSSCGNENKEGSRFCRHCGAQLQSGHFNSHKANTSFNFLKKFKARHYIIAVVSLFLLVGVAYGAVKGNDYLKVNAAINTAQQLNQSGDFQDALTALNTVKGHAVFSSQANALNDLATKEPTYIKDENELLAASTSIATGDFQSAQTSLEAISTDFPQYETVKNQLVYVQSQIEQNLQSQADQAKADAAAQAQAKAAAQAAAAAAKAQATAAANAKVAAEAQAAQAQQAQQAQATQAAAERRQSLLNQLTSIYTSFSSNGMANFNTAVTYSNAEDYTLAMSYSGEAESGFSATGDALTSLANNNSNIDSDISSAIETLQLAVLNCLEANTSFLAVIAGTGLASNTNYYSGLCSSDGNTVKAFLNSQ